MQVPFIYDKFYIPVTSCNKTMYEDINKEYTIRLYKDKNCLNCEYLPDRHSFMCDSCPNFDGEYKLYSVITYKKEKYIGLPVGDIGSIPKKFGFNKEYIDSAIDKRSAPKLSYDIEIKGLYEYQETVAKEWLTRGYGVLKAPPRSGKTLIAISIILKLGYKAIILVHQGDLLNNFIKDFETFTNVRDVEAFNGKPILGIVEKNEDFNKYEICLATYQKFISDNGRKLLKSIECNFGTLIIDEEHRANAKEFALTVSTLKCKHKGGITATPYRKDGRHVIGRLLIGPVVAEISPKTLKPEAILVETGLTPKNYSVWNSAMNWIASSIERNEIIVKHAVKNVNMGRHILITVARVSHAEALAEMINSHFDCEDGVVAEALHGKTDRQGILKRAREGATKVVVGMRQLIQVGINVPIWDCLYIVVPISNYPNHLQEVFRICTPMDGKPTPIIKHFIDDMGLQEGCLATCLKVYFSKKYCIVSPKNRKAMVRVTTKKKESNKKSYLNYEDIKFRNKEKFY